MKITNKLGLPEQLKKAIEVHNAEYKASKTGEEKYSVTQLISPAFQSNLKIEHFNDIEEDVIDSIWMLFGTAMHTILQKGADDNSFVEERLQTEVEGVKISGAPDYFTESLIQDYKITSAYTIVYGSRTEDWTQQLNIYRYLIFKHLGYEIKELEVVAILRDWSKTKVLQGGGYPQNQVAVVKLPVWDFEKTEEFIKERIEVMRQNQMCSGEERWDKPTVYAVMKEGRKSAVKLFNDAIQAEFFIQSNKDKDKMSITTRHGESTRCENYCSVNKWCPYYQEYLKQKEV